MDMDDMFGGDDTTSDDDADPPSPSDQPAPPENCSGGDEKDPPAKEEPAGNSAAAGAQVGGIDTRTGINRPAADPIAPEGKAREGEGEEEGDSPPPQQATFGLGIYGEPCLFEGRAKLLIYDGEEARWVDRSSGVVYLEQRVSDGTVTCYMHDDGWGVGVEVRLRLERAMLKHIVHPQSRFSPTQNPASVMFRARDHAEVPAGKVGFFILILRGGQHAADTFEAVYTGAVQRMGQAFGADGSENGSGGGIAAGSGGGGGDGGKPTGKVPLFMHPHRIRV
jgi:hypothetical protein